MSKTLWIDASVGIAGDMLLAALLDAGANVDSVRSGLETLKLPGWTLEPKQTQRGAFRATYAGVRVNNAEPDPHAGPPDGVPRGRTSEAGSTVGHTHGAHTHSHTHSHVHTHTASGDSHVDDSHRPYREVKRLLNAAGLPARVLQRALTVYDRLAVAEAHMHGMDIEHVVLHEVGAIDAIVDIVGCCLALEDLDIQCIIATPLPMGTGSVVSAHGVIPLPAPATLSICQGYPVVESRWPGEWVTPTGAALVCALATPGGVPAMTVRATGYGAGRKDPPQVANLVRVVLGDSAIDATDAVVEVAANVDDMIGEHIPGLIDALFAEGAVDAWVVPVLMKKGRPGYTVHALCKDADVDVVSDTLLRHSSTLGVRHSTHQRRILDRWNQSVDTAYGSIRVKIGGRDNAAWHASPEHGDVAEAARRHNTTERAVFDAALAALSTLSDGPKD